MAELTLKATITTIAKFEAETGKSLMTAFSQDNLGIATIVELTRACSGASDEAIDAYVAENGIEALTDKLVKAFEKSGFLGQDKKA